jgi:NADH pyrophosphatase NudC (nudix superfamily)
MGREQEVIRMKFCPECGKPLREEKMGADTIRRCDCGFIDWDNWVNVCVMAVCFNDRHEVLMVTLKGAESGKITFPGGYRNLGESLEEAAKREAWEESGFRVDGLKLYKAFTNDPKRLVWLVFVGKILDGHFQENDETCEARLLGIESLPSPDLMRGWISREILSDIRSGIL